MRKIHWLLITGTTLLLWGCPFGTEYTLGDAMLDKYDRGVLGYWENLTDSTNMFVSITPLASEFPDYVTVTFLKEKDNSGSSENEGEAYPAVFAQVDQSKYLIVEYYDELFGETSYYYYHYKMIDSKNLIISDVNPNIVDVSELTSAEDLLAVFKAKQSSPDFLIKERKYRKF